MSKVSDENVFVAIGEVIFEYTTDEVYEAIYDENSPIAQKINSTRFNEWEAETILTEIGRELEHIEALLDTYFKTDGYTYADIIDMAAEPVNEYKCENCGTVEYVPESDYATIFEYSGKLNGKKFYCMLCGSCYYKAARILGVL